METLSIEFLQEIVETRLLLQAIHARRAGGFFLECQMHALVAAILLRVAGFDPLQGPKPGLKTKPVVMVLDNGPIHVSKAAKAALGTRAHWFIVEWLPKYAPELNDIEPVWRDLKGYNLAHKTFSDAGTLDAAIHDAVATLNAERNRDPLGKLRSSA